MTIAYNFAIVPIPAEDKTSLNSDVEGNKRTRRSDRVDEVNFDVYFFTKETKKLNVLRIQNVYLSFFVHRIPGWTIQQTMRFTENCARGVREADFIYEYRTDLRDSCYTILGAKPFEYVEIFSKSPSKLKKLLALMSSELLGYYRYINVNSLDNADKVILRQTETPFRNTAHSTSLKDSCYWFSRTFSIPFVGFNQIDLSSHLVKEYKGEYLFPNENKVENVYYMQANDSDEYYNKNIEKVFKKWDVPLGYDAQEMNQIIIASYDIETYNRNELPSFRSLHQYIFNIGLSFFYLQQSKPFVRYSIITKDMKLDDTIKDRLIKLKDKDVPVIGQYEDTFAYRVEKEYSDDDPGSIYISVPDEKTLINVFIDMLNHYSPHIISQFNGWGFDCQWINSRVTRESFGKDLESRYLQVYSTYNIRDLKEDLDKFQHLMPKYRSFDVKLEGKVKKSDKKEKENYTVRALVIQSLDVMKLLMKADAKRFSQNWKLDYMLDSYHIKNPYNKRPLSKSGLSIQRMFELWDEDKGLYEIALYCMQDAWVCTTMLIERSNIIDKLAMSTITFTSFEDSIYRADGHRVSCLNAYYGWWYGFAYMDEGYEHRQRIKDENWKLDDDKKLTGLGYKHFDARKVMGGAVRNVHSRRCTGVVAADFSSMYPSQYRSGNVASSTHIDNEIVENPECFGLELVKKARIVDMFGERNVFYLKKIGESKNDEE